MLDPIIEKIRVARVRMLLKNPFFGNMATRMSLVDASHWCNTAATDFRNLYYNRDFFEKMEVPEVEFVLSHEILHCAFEHFLRQDSRDAHIWNIAADYCINGILVRDKIGTMPKSVKGYHDTKYNGWSAEQVYEDIFPKFNKEKYEQLGKLIDEHLAQDGDGKNGKPQISSEDARKIKDEVKEAMIEAIQASSSAGAIPGEIKRLFNELTEPKINWRTLLQQQIQSIIRNDYTFSRPSRKAWHSGAILPGTNFDTTIDVCLALDMSGSIGNAEATEMLSEVKGIMDQFKDFSLKIWCFDTQVYNEQDFDSYNAEEINDYEIKGGGGTSFEANWDYMKERNIVPKKFIMFTDMYPNAGWGDEDYCDTIFIAHGNSNIVAPYGITVQYE